MGFMGDGHGSRHIKATLQCSYVNITIQTVVSISNKAKLHTYLNQGPYSYKAALLPTAPPSHLLYFQI